MAVPVLCLIEQGIPCTHWSVMRGASTDVVMHISICSRLSFGIAMQLKTTYINHQAMCVKTANLSEISWPKMRPVESYYSEVAQDDVVSMQAFNRKVNFQKSISCKPVYESISNTSPLMKSPKSRDASKFMNRLIYCRAYTSKHRLRAKIVIYALKTPWSEKWNTL